MNKTVSQSRFWNPLWNYYWRAPSMAFSRTPELECASELNLSGRVLDHCCGDGKFAQLAWPGQIITAGCDLSADAVQHAQALNIYSRLDVCDVSQKLPYDDHSFDLVFNNSAIEHVLDLEATLAEVARVLAPNGVFVFNVLNHRYFEWWPLGEEQKKAYREWQPFYHALSMEEWKKQLERAGLKIESFKGYLDRKAARKLALLDYWFSGFYLRQRPSFLVRVYLRWPQIMPIYWRWRLSSVRWCTQPDDGAGYSFRVVHDHA